MRNLDSAIAKVNQLPDVGRHHLLEFGGEKQRRRANCLQVRSLDVFGVEQITVQDGNGQIEGRPWTRVLCQERYANKVHLR